MKTKPHRASGLGPVWRRAIFVGTLILVAGGVRAGDVRISQVYGAAAANNAANVNGDFVELVNTGPLPVNMTGWALNVSSGTGSYFWSRTEIPAGTVLLPGRHYTIRLETLSGGIPYKQDLNGLGSLGNTSGAVALMSTAVFPAAGACPTARADMVDVFGYGTSLCYLGAPADASLHTPGSNQAFFRRDDGCTNTSNSNADFVNAPANPRRAGGFSCTATVSPASIFLAGETLTFSVVIAATDIACTGSPPPSVGQLVTADLTELGGVHNMPMSAVAPGRFAISYSVPPTTSSGYKTVGFNCSDSSGRQDSTSIALSILFSLCEQPICHGTQTGSADIVIGSTTITGDAHALPTSGPVSGTGGFVVSSPSTFDFHWGTAAIGTALAQVSLTGAGVDLHHSSDNFEGAGTDRGQLQNGQLYTLSIFARGGTAMGGIPITGDALFDLQIAPCPTVWSAAGPAVSPPARLVHAMTYRSAGLQPAEILMFGGRSGGGTQLLGDTWSWNGSEWLARSTPAAPPARSDHAMAEGRNGTVILFGGKTDLASGVIAGDTWVWDGSAWTQRSFAPGQSPSARGGHAMAFDSVRNKTILFGGFAADGATVLSDTWEWDGVTWTLLDIPPGTAADPTRPSARFAHAMTFDRARGRVVLFGGYPYGPGETWEFDPNPATPLNQKWSRRSTTAPFSGFYASLAYDASRQRSVLFGGSSPINGTWAWDGAAWTSLSLACSPSQRYTSLASAPFPFESTAGPQVVMFGGAAGGVPPSQNDTWLLGWGPCACVTGPTDLIYVGRPVTLAVNTCGAQDATIQWYRNGVAVGSSSTATTYNLSAAELASPGEFVYQAKVTSACGNTRSGPFLLAIHPCLADVASLGGIAGGDGQLTADDVVYYLSQFFANNLAVADIVGLGGTAGPDNQITSDDLVAFLSAFFGGCP